MSLALVTKPNPVVVPVAGRIGAAVTGIDLSCRLDDETLGQLRQTLLENRVLFFPGQHLTEGEQVALAEQFGPITQGHPTLRDLSGSTGVFDLDSGRGARANNWHTDVTFVDRPPAISVLRAVTIPPFGGDTVWANTVAAYEGLPAELRAEIELLDVIHSNDFDYAKVSRVDASDGASQVRDYAASFSSTTFRTLHPLVHVHPETGEHSLLAGGFAREIAGWAGVESATLLRTLHDAVTRLENTVRWRWSEGDVVIWDNRSTQHYAIADYGDQPRRVQRVTVAGSVPRGVDGRAGWAISGDSTAYLNS